jgi:hypothetical protein
MKSTRREYLRQQRTAAKKAAEAAQLGAAAKLLVKPQEEKTDVTQRTASEELPPVKGSP